MRQFIYVFLLAYLLGMSSAQAQLTGTTTSDKVDITRTFKVPFRYVGEYNDHDLFVKAIYTSGGKEGAVFYITLSKEEQYLDSEGNVESLKKFDQKAPLEFSTFESKYLEVLAEIYKNDEERPSVVQRRYTFELFGLLAKMQLKPSTTPIAGTLSIQSLSPVFSSEKPEPSQQVFANRKSIINRYYKAQGELKNITYPYSYDDFVSSMSSSYKVDQETKKIIGPKLRTSFAESQRDFFYKLEISEYSITLFGRTYTAKDTTDTTARRIYNKISGYKMKVKQYLQRVDSLAKPMQDSSILKVVQISMKIERGFIEDLHILMEDMDGQKVWFDNTMPIGISSMRDLKNFPFIRIFSRLPMEDGDVYQYVYLSDILQGYEINEDLLTRDLSPGDTVVLVNPATDPTVILYRDREVRLFDARIYTDLQGLDNQSNNGIIQIEAQRRFNLNTRRYEVAKPINYGFCNYLSLGGGFTKIENKLKELPLQNIGVIQNGQIVSPNYVTNLNLRRYESFFLNIDITAFLFDWKTIKSIFYFEPGIRYGYVPIVDSVKRLKADGTLEAVSSVKRSTNASTFTPYFRIRYEFISERRISFGLAYQWNYAMLASNNLFRQVASEQKSDLTLPFSDIPARVYHQWELNVKYMTNIDDYVYFRSRFFFQDGDANTFFPQLQLGFNYTVAFKR